MVGALMAAGAMVQYAAKVNWARIWRAVKLLGITAVASSMAMDEGELAGELLKHPVKRKKKGITGRQLTSARRVNRVVTGWAKSLSGSATSRRSPARKCK